MEKTTKNRIIVIEGPSGAGKDTIIKTLMQRYPDRFGKLVSVATRQMRPNESQGNPYHFVSNEEFDQMVTSGDIFEHTVRHGEKRGMSERYILELFDAKKIPLKDCDIVGVRALKSRFENVLTIFITADKNEIERRLIARGDKPEDIKLRMADYDKCILDAKYYDYVIENKDLEKTIDKIIEIIYN
ncbi:MAG: AAA family ATPase [Clostridia bacterium]|nr:AAA family ATPase [Clostridia bacterium]